VRSAYSLAERALNRILDLKIRGLTASTDVTMKRRVRPICDAVDQAMFDRIKIAVRNVRAQILVVSDVMPPVPALPNATLAARASDWIDAFSSGDALSEVRLNESPSGREITVAWG
jgi:hypothetical protein